MSRRILAAGRRGVRGLGGRRFHPSQLGSNLVQWTKAAAANVTLVGSEVSQWDDLTANAYHFIAPSARRPAWNASDSAFAGHPSLQFVHANQEYMNAAGVATNHLRGDDFPYTIAAAVQFTATGDTTYDYIWCLTYSSQLAPVQYLSHNSTSDADAPNGITVRNFRIAGDDLKIHDTGTTPSDPVVLVYTTSGTYGRLYRNGVLVAEGSMDMNGASQDYDQWIIGGYVASFFLGWSSSKFAEIIVADREVTAGEVAGLTSFLAGDKGI